MRPRDWFLVGIRIFGAWPIYRGVIETTNFLTVLLGVMPDDYRDQVFGGSTERAATNYLLYAVANFVIGLYFVFGGESLTKWVFGEYPPESDDEEEGAVP